MWKRDEAVKPTGPGNPAAPAAPAQPAGAGQCAGAAGARRQQSMERDVVNIGKSVVIKGELNGSEDLTDRRARRRQDRASRSRADDRTQRQDQGAGVRQGGHRARRGERQRHGDREGGHPRRRIGRRRHRVAARRHRRGRALPRQRGHAAQGRRSRRRRARAAGSSVHNNSSSSSNRQSSSSRRTLRSRRPRTMRFVVCGSWSADWSLTRNDQSSATNHERRMVYHSVVVLSDLFSRKRKDEPDAAEAGAGCTRSSNQGALEVSLQPERASRSRCCSTSAPSSAPTSRSSARNWAARSWSRTSSKTSTGTLREGKVEELPAFLAKRFPQADDIALTASCAGTSSIISIGRPRRRWRAELVRIAPARRRAAGAVQHDAVERAWRRQRTRSTSSSIGRRCNTGRMPRARGKQRPLVNRDIQRMFEPLRITESFLLKNNLREVLFRKPAADRAPMANRSSRC